MKKILIIKTILFIALNILPAHGFDNEWEGNCYIEYNDKIYVNNEKCKIDQMVMYEKDKKSLQIKIKNKENFNVRVVKEVLCDDGSNNCAYYFYADFYNDKENKKIYSQISFNIDKTKTKYPANLGEDFTIKPYILNNNNVGICYIKLEDKFCWGYNN